MKRLLILYSDYSPVIDAIKYTLQDTVEIVCEKEHLSEVSDYDLIVIVGSYNYEDTDAIKVHYSLLPAFNGEEPVKEAIIAGAKVTGITFFYTKTKKIIAQYPIFIKNDSHYEDIEQELKYIEQTLYPIIIEKILNCEQFEIKSLVSNSCCTGGCSGCRK